MERDKRPSCATVLEPDTDAHAAPSFVLADDLTINLAAGHPGTNFDITGPSALLIDDGWIEAEPGTVKITASPRRSRSR